MRKMSKRDMRYQYHHNLDPGAGARREAAQAEFRKGEAASVQKGDFPKPKHTHVDGKGNRG